MSIKILNVNFEMSNVIWNIWWNRILKTVKLSEIEKMTTIEVIL